MGLSRTSTGAVLTERRGVSFDADRVILLAGHPNVGKSTLFNRLTGRKQHTGNWTGKTVSTAVGYYRAEEGVYAFLDLPGCYSLNARSDEERVARDAIAMKEYDRVVVVCDASCLERNLTLAMQILELCPRTVLCINLLDEARRKGIEVDAERLSAHLGLPVVAMSARKGKEGYRLLPSLELPITAEYLPRYPQAIEEYITDVSSLFIGEGLTRRQTRAVALHLLDPDPTFAETLAAFYRVTPSLLRDAKKLAAQLIRDHFDDSREAVGDVISEAIAAEAAKAAALCITKTAPKGRDRDRTLDRLFLGRFTAFPLMFLFLFLILWLTIKGANVPSALLSDLFASLEGWVNGLLCSLRVPPTLIALLCEGVIRVVGWVVSVMLPPMAIFFPLFTLLEDVGYLPRIAFNLDRCFRGCHACGKQALTMCMGLGCNAAGVVGCRIIDSRRERLLALLTNSFMPCNGRFPILIAVISMFFAASGATATLLLCAVILLAVLITLLICKLLSVTALRGVPSSFTLELPSYRAPKIGQVLLRSVFDRTLFVLGRAVAVAAPTGALLWLLANCSVEGGTLLHHLAAFFEPMGQLMGLDGVILLAFLLGLPANEIVIPIILLCYLSGSSLSDYSSLASLKAILVDHGWTAVTAINMLLFTVFHWPCSTTILTIHKETGSLSKTIAAVLLPTAVGVLLCVIVNGLASL